MIKNTIFSQIISRNDISQNWEIKNPILSKGEIGYDSTNKKIKIGDGVSHWNDLNYVLLDELNKKVDKTEIANTLNYGGEKNLDQINNDTSLCVKNMIYTGTYNISTENSTTKYSIKYSAADYTDPTKQPEMIKFIGVCEKDVIIHIKYTRSSINLETDVIGSDRNGPTIYLKDKIFDMMFGELGSGTSVKITSIYKTSLTVNSDDYVMWNGSEWVSFSSSISIINNLTSTLLSIGQIIRVK